MPRRGVGRSTAQAIRGRLLRFVDEVHGGDWDSFRSSVSIERTTIAGWKGSGSAVPEVAHLVTLAQRGRLSLDWLLLGMGPMLLDESQRDFVRPQELRALLVARFAGTDCADAAEADRCLPPAGVIWRHMVDSLRPFVHAARAALRRDEREIARWTDQLILEYERGSPAARKLVLQVAAHHGVSERQLRRILRGRREDQGES